jgi:uncharacterized protein
MSEVQAIVVFMIRELLHLLPWFLVAILLGVAAQHLHLDVITRRTFRRHGVTGIFLTTAVGAFSPFVLLRSSLSSANSCSLEFRCRQ